ncbi:MAG: hypothetical protein IPG96_12375 [Proteobacteria bacterium]|nr:hypothetical protein [Pseudomonadota bacterium]
MTLVCGGLVLGCSEGSRGAEVPRDFWLGFLDSGVRDARVAGPRADGAMPSDGAVPTDSAAASCSDGVRNGGEVDVDCGGACAACADGRSCTGPQECRGGVCSAAGRCETCASGYRIVDGRSCVDLDECAGAAANCHADATCTNTPGSFTCACKSAFRGDGITCQAAVTTLDYAGALQTWTAPITASVLVEVWGAQGGGARGGLGGYTKGTLAVVKGEVLSVFAGQQPSTRVGGWNGGGSSQVFNDSSGSGGGGASDVRRGGTALGDRIIVAGGGGGGGGHFGGAGGGAAGAAGSALPTYAADYCGKGGTQSAGGAGGSTYACSGGTAQLGGSGRLGLGGDGGKSSDIGWADGGGGGYYGGGGGGGACTGSFPGGGGSGYFRPELFPDGATNSGVRTGHGLVRFTLP